MSKAVVLLSGGLDSATCLAIAQRDGFEAYALSFDYGQRNNIELQQAKQVAKHGGAAAHKIFQLPLSQFGGSALTDDEIAVPDAVDSNEDDIPVTYVPNRNTIFISVGLAWAEVLGATALYIGANAVDYSGYPDCRPEYFEAWQQLANLSTKAAIEGQPPIIHTPLLALSKQQIVELGTELGVDYSLTVTCYQPNDQAEACGHCDACKFRHEGFLAAGLADPTRYAASKSIAQ